MQVEENTENIETNDQITDTESSTWYSDYDLEEGMQTTASKFQSPEDVLKSYHSLEKKLSTRNDLDHYFKDDEGRNQVLDKLGRPESADKYEFESLSKLPENAVDQDKLSEIKGIMYDAGVPSNVANDLIGRYVDELQTIMDHFSEESHVNSEEDNAAFEKIKTDVSAHFRKEWGDNFEANEAVVNKGLESLGLSGEVANDILNSTKLDPQDRIKLLEGALKMGEMFNEGGLAPANESGSDLANLNHDDLLNKKDAISSKMEGLLREGRGPGDAEYDKLDKDFDRIQNEEFKHYQ